MGALTNYLLRYLRAEYDLHSGDGFEHNGEPPAVTRAREILRAGKEASEYYKTHKAQIGLKNKQYRITHKVQIAKHEKVYNKKVKSHMVRPQKRMHVGSSYSFMRR